VASDPVSLLIKQAVRDAIQEASLLPSRRVLDLHVAAEYLGLTPDALRHKVAAGEIPTVRLDRKYRFDIRDLDSLIENSKDRGR
jgi:excisionase family DNA binding protein